MSKFERGSEWRKWDLHIHTPSSDASYKGEDYDDLLVEAWKENEFAAVAITDHFRIDAERIQSLRNKAPEITIFPGVELRTDKGGDNIHVILLFSEDYDLEILSNDFEAIMIRDKNKNRDDFETIYWDYKEIVDFANKKDAIISLHAGSKSEGIEKIKNSLPVSMAIKKEYAESAHIFEIGKLKDIEEYKTIVFESIQMEKPLIICSDNHDPRNYSLKEYLWLKADLTFCGLKQVINHPSERVFVGNTPPKVDQSKKNPEKYIESVKVKKKTTARNNEKWFDFEIPLNIGLISIIGNKGSGKSAFSDIIAHACCSRNIKKASFLNGKRFRNKQKNYASDYESEVIWKNENKTSTETLQEDISSSVELVKYLPQSYIEEVCNELDDSFQQEIDKVIFSYIDPSERISAKSLNEIISNKTLVINNEINELTAQLGTLNQKIVNLEHKSVPAYKKSLKDLLDKQIGDYKTLCENPPLVVQKPTDKLDNKKDHAIQEASDFIDKLSDKIKEQHERIIVLNNEITMLNWVYKEVVNIEKSISIIKMKIDSLNKHNIELESWNIELITDKDLLGSVLAHLNEEQSNLVEITSEYTNEIPLINEIDIENSYNELLETSDSLNFKIKLTEAYKSLITNETTLAQRQYQKYLDDVKQWEDKKSSLMGDAKTKDTIKYLKQELDYVDQKLIDNLNDEKSKRRILVGKIFDCLLRKVSVYEDIYRPIKNKIGKLLCDIDDEVSFIADISCKIDIGSGINKRINKSVKSQLYRAEGDKMLNDIIDSTNFSDKESTLNFINQIFDCITEDTDIDKILKGDRVDFSNFIASLNYLDVDFNLTMGGLTLDKMSPGQRGTVLLIFYLALDKDDSPLIIDQPEDNLDNQSVFDKLVPCILAAKKSRQIIIVTHNPNIAIACDAEQIISCKIDKQTHEIAYMSGSIEKSDVKDSIVKILEGTQPAFDLRNKKYSYYSDGL